MLGLRLFILLALLLAPLSKAQALSLIRDAEIEANLRAIASPVLRAAGLNPKRVNIYIVDDPRLNAFVAGGSNIFINSGMLVRLPKIEMLQAVIAHEAAHITGGHLALRGLSAKAANSITGIGIALAAASATAGGGDAAAAIASTATQVARRSHLAHSRANEAAADQAGLSYMATAGIDPNAAIEVLELFKGQEVLSIRRIDPYALTHPIYSNRIASLKAKAAALQGNSRPTPDTLKYRHARMVAKFEGFTQNPRDVIRRYSKAGNSETALTARIAAYHRLGDKLAARKNLQQLMQLRPDDPYYNELAGQILLESNEVAAAVKFYERAVRLSNDPQIQAGLARAYLARNQQGDTGRARDLLRQARERDPRNARILRDLGRAEAASGNDGLAALASAERLALGGRTQEAARHATHAQGLLKPGSAAMRRAQDIIATAKSLN